MKRRQVVSVAASAAAVVAFRAALGSLSALRSRQAKAAHTLQLKACDTWSEECRLSIAQLRTVARAMRVLSLVSAEPSSPVGCKHGLLLGDATLLLSLCSPLVSCPSRRAPSVAELAATLVLLPHQLASRSFGWCSVPASLSASAGVAAHVVVGDGLGSFVIGQRCSFVVQVSQVDGRPAIWLCDADVALSAASLPLPTTAFSAGTASVDDSAYRADCSVSVGGRVVVSYVILHRWRTVQLRLHVCGVVVGEWEVKQARNTCTASGNLSRTIPLRSQYNKFGLAVNSEGTLAVVALYAVTSSLDVYALPSGDHIRSIGGEGSANGLLFVKDSIRRICFGPNGNVVVALQQSKRLQEVSLHGDLVRSFGADVYADTRNYPFSVATSDGGLLAVGSQGPSSPKITVFDFATGLPVLQFGDHGRAPGELGPNCDGIRFTPDQQCILVSEQGAGRVSMFTVAGTFVRCFCGSGVLRPGGFMDVDFTVRGEIVVADFLGYRVCVYSPEEDGALLRTWPVPVTAVNTYGGATALAVAGPHLYVMNYCADGMLFVYE